MFVKAAPVVARAPGFVSGVEVRLLGPRIPPEGGDRGLPEAGSSPLLSVVILGHWVIVSSCAFAVDRRPLVEHSSSKYTQA